MGEVATYRRGSFPQPYGKSEWYDGNGAMPFVQVADVSDEMNLVGDTKQKISILAQPMSVFAEQNSVLVTLQGSIGRVAIMQYEAFVDRTVLIFEKYKAEIDKTFWAYIIKQKFIDEARKAPGGTIKTITKEALSNFDLSIPKYQEQKQIGAYFCNLDNLITLHQRNNKEREGDSMDTYNGNELFYKYYEKWIKIYKEGAIRNSTMNKYKLSLKWLKKIAPKLKTKEVNRITYQEILNAYAANHERQSTMDFHHQLKSSILDAVDDGLIEKNPTRKAIIKGKMPTREKKEKFLNQFELQKLLSVLKLEDSINNDWLIYLIAKTGLRFSEALGLTPKDFDFEHQLLCVDKTWNYKEGYGFEGTKNKSSTRKIQLDWQTIIQFSRLIKDEEENKPIFINSKIYNSTINEILARHCKEVDIPIISIHGLRHTHASLLLYSGVSVSSVAHRLGHASMTTTQKTYLHIIQELENTDLDKIMRTLASLNN